MSANGDQTQPPCQVPGMHTNVYRDSVLATARDTEAPASAVPPAACNIADLNADNNLAFNDINLFVSAFLGNTSEADLNMDGAWDFNDINLFVSAFLSGCP